MRLSGRHHHGIGLIELLCVLAIVAITTAFATTHMQTMRQKHSVHTKTADFVSSLRFARDQAISLGTRVSVCRTQDGMSCAAGSAMTASGSSATSRDWASGWIVFTDSGSRGEIDGDDRLLWREGPWLGGHIDQADRAGKYVLSYQATGLGIASAMSFVVSSSSAQPISQTVCISLSGQVRQQEGKC